MLGAAAALTLVACGGGDNKDQAATGGQAPTAVGTHVEADEQRPGDAAAGYHALVHEGYVGCGIPYDTYTQFFPTAPANLQLPDREGHNAEMAFMYNVFTSDQGVELVMPNCLTCHAQVFQGQVVVGLGDTITDYTIDNSAQLEAATLFVEDPDAKAEMEKFAQRGKAMGPYITPVTVGVNPAENITAVLIAHHDQQTLAWSDEPLLPLPPQHVVPVDVPPWWRMKHKNAMFYVAAGRGDHARIMMTASTACIDDVEQARQIDSYFPDVRAFIEAIEAPPYPLPIDDALADRGREVFEATCAGCHGTYGSTGSYPNLLIDVDDVGTDPTLASASAHYADDFVDWYNGSFYGEVSTIAPQHGYVAPPLDGVWITAPYLHNGSVPNLELLLDSSRRPTYWTRSYDSDDYDMAVLGYPYTELATGQADEPDFEARKLIYDTTLLGYGNGGHTYGDGLTVADRSAVIEYLKTL